MARLRDRIAQTAETRGELVLYKLDRPTEIACVRCAAHATTRWVAVQGDDWTRLWCRSCFLAMPS
jgi:hypothetical protein